MLCKILFWIFLVFFTALYILAHLFIPVEAFILVQSLPLGAFATVAWMEYWPRVWEDEIYTFICTAFGVNISYFVRLRDSIFGKGHLFLSTVISVL